MEQTKTEQVSSQTATKGQAVADFELTGVDGKTYRLSDYKGKKIYLKFWASWCSICLASLPDTDEIAKEAGDDYVVLTVVSPGHKGEQAEADFKNWVPFFAAGALDFAFALASFILAVSILPERS